MLKCYEKNSAPKLVFGSVHGQIDRLKKLTEQYKSENEVSPIAFSASVHNNTIGVFSLINKINSSYTALSAGNETVSSCICDSVLQLTEENDVLMCCADVFEEKSIAVSVLFSLHKTENSIAVQLCRENSTQSANEYKDFSDFLNGKNSCFNSQYFRLEKL